MGDTLLSGPTVGLTGCPRPLFSLPSCTTEPEANTNSRPQAHEFLPLLRPTSLSPAPSSLEAPPTGWVQGL